MSAPSLSPSPRIAWSRRADLQLVPLEFSGRRSWGVKDPVTLAYFELRDEEHFVLNQLDGRRTVEEVCNLFDQRFRPATLSAGELQQFVGQLVSQGLLMSFGAGYGRMLTARDEQKRSHRRWARLGNILVVRFRGFDPDRLLERILVGVGWLFSPAAIAICLTLIVAAVVLVVVQFDRVVERLPETRALLATPNLIWLPVLLAAVKMLHEIGHGLTCKRFGGECRELGVMLLVFTPTLYCNVSDMWMVRDKWKRIAVSAAGIWVELVIAAACTLLWWFSAPGLFHSMCLNLMFICGVSTILFNGNPLLRYDGYFVMADWLEIPNLQQQSAASIRGWMNWWFCGITDRQAAEQTTSRKSLLLIYGIASTCYRMALTFVILWSLYRWMEPLGLGSIVQVLAIPMVGMMVLSPGLAMYRYFRSAETRSQIDWSRFRIRMVVTLVLVGLLLTIPVPSRVGAGALLDQDTAQRVYATVGGTLESALAIGDRVEAGQEIVRLSNPGIQAELIRLEGEYDLHRLRLEHLERRRVRDPEVAALIPAVREAMRDYETQAAQLRSAADRLVLRAPCGGLVLPAPLQSAAAPSGALPAWSGSPLENRNRDCFVRPGTTVCLVGPEESRTAVLLINQDDINLVREGQTVRMVWRELSGEVLSGKIVEVAALDLELLPRDAVQRLNLPVRSNASGGLTPVGMWYQARVRLDPTDVPLFRGAAGDAKILVAPQSLGARIARWLARTFG